MSAAQSTTVHDGLLHPHLRHCSLPASAVRRLPSAVHTATLAFDVRSSGLFCSRPGGLELVTRLPAWSVTFLWQFFLGSENFSGFTSVHCAFVALRLWALSLAVPPGLRLADCCLLVVRSVSTVSVSTSSCWPREPSTSTEMSSLLSPYERYLVLCCRLWASLVVQLLEISWNLADAPGKFYN